ncbi:hypothetical protein OROMI_014161 [Orobanche minor]
MSQDRLNGLAILSIEKNMLKNIDVDCIIDDFASRSAEESISNETTELKSLLW